ncbi:hypothetical protein QTI51_32365 [Variovorax sp. J22G73]|uniref:hypothetical protein n=1 Tax=unclassified Variovorax TaxID=663243 RepID=UPI0025764355|nr:MULTISPECIES: hypothetical protein [unclassified Variovorax]MDM0009501.1 hypothetical protein [Variovorax sp. J22R203]MDM0102009.1 hypothetical protein [Variovorax sp. J22G73]
MATSSILGGERPPAEARGIHDDSVSPSDSSDSGSDALGTGGRALAEAGLEGATNADILPERIGVFPDGAVEASSAVDDSKAARVDELAAHPDPEDGDTDVGEDA